MNDVERGQLCNSALSALHHGAGALSQVPGLVRRIIEEEAWKSRKVPLRGIVELSGLAELITRKPMEGWGEDPAKIEALIGDDPEVSAMFREAMTGEPHRPKGSGDNITSSQRVTGTSRAYTLSRLKKHHPALFERVKKGELTANAAAVEAGFRKVKTPLQQLKYWWGKASEEERNKFRMKWFDAQ